MSVVRGEAPDSVAVVMARDQAASIGPLVERLLAGGTVGLVVVVDNGSTDDTSLAAARAGARVVRFAARVTEARATETGLRLALGEATPEQLLTPEPVVRPHLGLPEAPVLAGEPSGAVAPPAPPRVVLLVEADLVGDGAGAELVVQAVRSGRAGLALGVFPADVRQRGGPVSRRLAGALVKRATGVGHRAPLVPLRAVSVPLLQRARRPEPGQVASGDLDTGLLIDANRPGGGGVVEIALAAPHDAAAGAKAGHPGRPDRGLVWGVLRAGWPRLTTASFRRWLLVGSTIALVVLLVGAGLVGAPASVAPDGHATKVVLFGIPHLGLDDLQRGYTPNLDRLVRGGAVSATAIRTQVTSATSTEAYATIGAGTRVHVDPNGPAPAATDGGPLGAAVVVPDAAQIIDQAGSDLSSEPGALGEELRKAGKRTAVIGNSDTVSSTGARVLLRPTPLALMDRSGRVDAGTVTGILQVDPAAPFGMRANPDAILQEFDKVAPAADVVLVDPGDTERSALYDGVSSPAAAVANRQLALRRTDALLGQIESRLGPDTMLLVVSPLPAHGSWGLTPTIASGATVRHGSLYSVSTKRVGLVTITDIAPTVLSTLGLKVPSGMIGAPLRYHPGTVQLSGLRHQDQLAAAREGLYYPMSSWFILGQVVFYLLAFFALQQRTGRSPRGWIRMGLLAIAAWPLATFVIRAIPGINTANGTSAHVVVWAVAFLIAALAARSRHHALSALGWICGATVAVLVIDLAFGANLEMSSVLGYSPYNAARFTGIGNTTLGILAGSTVLAAVIHLRLSSRFKEARRTAFAILVVVLLACMLPMLGNKVGSILTLVPAFGVLAYLLGGKRLSLRSVVVGVLATVGVLGAVAGLDLLRPPDRRTHLGRFASDLFAGNNNATTTIVRKLQTNLHVSQTTIWLWMVPITLGVALAVLVVHRGWVTLTPPRSVLRVGTIGIFVAGLVGWAVNDSGVIVPALTWIYVGPFLLLLLVDRRTATPELIEPLASEPPEPVPVGAAAI